MRVHSISFVQILLILILVSAFTSPQKITTYICPDLKELPEPNHQDGGDRGGYFQGKAEIINVKLTALYVNVGEEKPLGYALHEIMDPTTEGKILYSDLWLFEWSKAANKTIVSRYLYDKGDECFLSKIGPKFPKVQGVVSERYGIKFQQ